MTDALRLLGCDRGLPRANRAWPSAWLAANAGANPRELMERMGHDSARAALIYLHSSAERQRALASKVGKNAKAALGKPDRSGTPVARKRGKTG